MTRQLREIIGRVQRGLARLKIGLVAPSRVLGRLAFLVLTLALVVVSACLITENKDFVGSTSPPIPVATSPPPQTRVPWQGDPDCTSAPSIQFEATVLDQDLDAPLYARLIIVNGNSDIPKALDPKVLEKTGRTTRSYQQCVPFTDLIGPCSIVKLLVSSDLSALYMPPPLGVLDPAATFGPVINWIVLGSASEGEAEANFSDCPGLRPDGGL